MGHVYLIAEVDDRGDEVFKIGITKNNPHLRVKTLQTGNPNKLSLLGSYQSDNFRKIENWLHRLYASCRTEAKNEWFRLSVSQVKDFKNECQEIDTTIEALKEFNPFYN